MKTLKEHNDAVHALYSLKRQANPPAGVKCDSCDVEMLHVNINEVYTSNPPKQKVYCPKCNDIQYMVV